MDDLIQAIASNDIVKVKQCFNEAMKEKVVGILDTRKKQIAESVMIEGEEKSVEDDEDEDDEDEDDSNEDEDEDE